MSGLSITIDPEHTAARRYILQGRIGSEESNILQHELLEAERGGCSHLVINMRQVTFLSSAGIRVLLMFFKRAKGSGSFHIEDPSDNVTNVLGITALREMIT